MPNRAFRSLLLAVWIGCVGGGSGWASDWVEVWLTHPEGTARFERQAERVSFRSGTRSEGRVIQVDSTRRHQPIEGFGYTLTGGSAQLLMAMSPAARAALLRELFGTEGSQIGVSYLRLTVGASDLNDRVFTYNDLPPGETDPGLNRFDLGPDRRDVLPVLREILAIQPDLRLLASPWSAPSWMKTNQDSKGGTLKPEWYAAYARYLVKYVQAMQAEGIRIHALTVQNEPLNPAGEAARFQIVTPAGGASAALPAGAVATHVW
jgi:glucosylceramidase